MVYVLGFSAADGYITVNRRGGQFWCVDITDKKPIEDIRKTIGADHKISIRKRHKDKYTGYRLQIGSIEMCDDLRNLGFSERKTKSLIVPNVLNKYFSDFVRGYFDGDGNVWFGYAHKERNKPLPVVRTTFTSCFKIFLNALEKRLLAEGVEKGVLGEGRGGYFRLTYSIYGSLKLYKLMYNRHILENNLFLK